MPAPDTIDAALDFARDTLDVVAPAGDLMMKDSYRRLMSDVTSGFVVGKSIVGGVRCDHLAFRSRNVDWQIWIDEGDKPLPRKYVITSLDVVGQPQFEVLMSNWTTAPDVTAKRFEFVPPLGARKTEFKPQDGEPPMISFRKSAFLGASFVLLSGVQLAPDDPLGLSLLATAQAVVGAPLTPVSVSGVARRTAVRTSAAAASSASSSATTSQQQEVAAQQQEVAAQQQQAAAQQQEVAAQQQATAQQQSPPPAVGPTAATRHRRARPAVWLQRDGRRWRPVLQVRRQLLPRGVPG